jgi:hypothetical protein
LCLEIPVNPSEPNLGNRKSRSHRKPVRKPKERYKIINVSQTGENRIESNGM